MERTEEIEAVVENNKIVMRLDRWQFEEIKGALNRTYKQRDACKKYYSKKKENVSDNEENLNKNSKPRLVIKSPV